MNECNSKVAGKDLGGGGWGKSGQKSEKGAGASPLLFLIDAPKPETESRFGSGHPGKPIFFKVAKRRASGMPAVGYSGVNRQTI
jgi:hypothetical protein